MVTFTIKKIDNDDNCVKIKPGKISMRKILKHHKSTDKLTISDIVNAIDVDAGIWAIRCIPGEKEKKLEFAEACHPKQLIQKDYGVKCACPHAEYATIAAIHERLKARTNAEKQAIIEKQGKELMRVFS